MSTSGDDVSRVPVRPLSSEELRLLRERIGGLADVAADVRERLDNILNASGCPDHALVLARTEAERLVKRVLPSMNVEVSGTLDGCLKKLEDPQAKKLVPQEIASLLHTLRVLGNKATHVDLKIEPTARTVYLATLVLLEIVEWYFVTFSLGPQVKSLTRTQVPRRIGVPWQTPPLPGHYLHRPREEAQLTQALLYQSEGLGVVVSAVFGQGGIGKTTLTAAVAHSVVIQSQFSDGLLWVTLGQEPDLLLLLGRWIRDLGDYNFQPMDVSAASGRLQQLLAERAMLLVVDDAWQSEHVTPFHVGGPRCRVLVTTRRASIADALGAARHELDVLEPAQAVELLASRLQRALRAEEVEPARRLAEAVGRLPLALELAAVRIGRGVRWEELLAKLGQEVAALEALEDPAERWKAKRSGKVQLEASLHLSLRALLEEAPEAWRCFVWLGVLPDDTTLTGAMAATLWDMDAEEADGLLEFLWGEALLQSTAAVRVEGREWRAYRVHDLLHDCARRLLSGPTGAKSPSEMRGLGLLRREAHGHLLDRYRKRIQGEQWHMVPVDGYVHGRLTWHAEQAGRTEEVHALLRESTPEGRNGWYEVNDRLGQPGTFVADVRRAWELANAACVAGKGLGRQCRYALVMASLNSLAANLPAELLEALVREGMWPLGQAVAYARLKPDAEDKVEALRRLSGCTTKADGAELLAETLRATREIVNESACLQVLADMAGHLPQELLGEALHTARDIRDESVRAQALAALAAHLPQELLAEALQAARDFRDEYARAQVLVGLAGHLPQELLAEALRIACDIRYESARARALAGLAARQLAESRSPALDEALHAARDIGDKFAQTRALMGRIPRLPTKQPPSALADALHAARRIRNESARAQVLVGLSGHLTRELLAEALQAARDVADKSVRAGALAGLARHLPAEQRSAALAEALHAARAIRDEYARAQALAALAGHLTQGLLAEALHATRDIRYDYARAQALAALAGHLSAKQRPVALAEALHAARDIQSESARAETLAGLAGHLPQELLGEALHAARDIRNEDARARALAGLAGHLPQELLGEALHTARDIRNESFRARALAEIARHLAVTAQPHHTAAWPETLHFLASHTRPDLLRDIHALTPLISALAGTNAQAELSEVAQAILDVSRWWP